MEDEIDLREYIAVLLRHWRLIAALTFVAAVIAGAVSFIIPPTYEAAAVISTTATGIPALATSDAGLVDVIASLGPTIPASLASPAALRPFLAAQAANTTTIQLKVKDGDAARAAAIANAWADALLAKIGPQSDEVSSIPLLQAGLNARISLLANVSASQYALEWAIEDAASLRDRLASRSPNSLATVEDQVLLISLSSQVVTGTSSQMVSGPSSQTVSGPSLQMVTGPMLPVQLQITGLTETTVGDQLEYLDDLAVSLGARRQILQRRAASLQNDIRGVQERLAKAQALTATPVPVQVIQRAQSADTPTSPKKAQNAALAAALGLMAGIFAVFGWEWWKGGGKQAAVEAIVK